MSRIFLENLVRRHFPDGLGDARAHEVDYLTAPDDIHERDDDQPYQEASAADDECVFQSDNVAETEHGRTRIELEHELGLVGNGLSDRYHGGGQCLSPGSEGGDDEVVQSADQSAEYQCFGALSPAFAANQHLGGGRGLRERILSVHLLYEILPERNQEEDSQHASEQGGEEHLHETDLDAEDVDGRQCEDCARHHGSRAASDGLDDDILAQAALLSESSCQAGCNDGDRNGRLEYLADLEAEIGCRRREDDDHHNSDAYGIEGHFRIGFLRAEQGFVFLSRLQLSLRILRQRSLVFFHI